MIRVTRFAFLIAASAALATNAHATSLENLAGTVRLNKGDGFKAVSGTERVRPGDTVMVEGKSEGTLLCSDGCSVPVRAGSVFTIPEVSPCALSAQFPPPAPGTAAGGFGGGLGGLGGLAGLAGIAGIAGASIAGAAIANQSNNNFANQQKQLLNAAFIAQTQQRPATP